MNSVQQKGRRCQATPSLVDGIVVGIDVSKGVLHYGAYRPGWEDRAHKANRDAEGFAQLRSYLSELKQDRRDLWVAFEPTGPYSLCLREWLLTQPCRTVQVNPFHTKRIKELSDNSPEKSDEKDPGVIADLIWQGKYMNLLQIEGIYAELRNCSVLWDALRKDHNRLKNQIHAQVESWFPELEAHFSTLTCLSARALIRKYESPAAISASSPKHLAKLLKKSSGGLVKAEKAAAIREAARLSVSVKAGSRSSHYTLCVHLERFEQIEKLQAELKGRMQEYLANLPLANALLTIPGIGVVTVAGLLGECGDLSQYRSAEALEKAIGMNICRVSSGKYEGKRRISKRGRSRARYLICEAAMRMMKEGGLFHDQVVEAARRRGEKHSSMKLRVATGRKLIRLLYAIACSCQPFDRRRLQSVTGARVGHGPVIPQGSQPQTV